MAVGGQAGAGDRALHLLPQQRDRARVAAVGHRGEQPGEQPDADDLAFRPEPADADRIHQGIAVDRGAPAGLRDEEQLAPQQESLDVARQRAEIPQSTEQLIARLAQDPKRRAWLGVASGEDVLAKPEIGEVVVVEPSQKIDALRKLGRPQWRRILA